MDTKKLEKYCAEYDYEKIHAELNQKLKPNHDCIKNLCENFRHNGSIDVLDSILLLFFNYGYDLTDDDVIMFVKNRIDISGVKKDISDELYNKLIPVCNEYDFYIYNVKCNLSAFKKKLSFSLNFLKYIDMKKFMEQNDIIPDLECLQIISKFQQRSNHIKYFIREFGIIPDHQCIKNSINCDSMAQVKILFDEYVNHVVPKKDD